MRVRYQTTPKATLLILCIAAFICLLPRGPVNKPPGSTNQTLQVYTRQAEALQPARDSGNIPPSIRNPSGKDTIDIRRRQSEPLSDKLNNRNQRPLPNTERNGVWKSQPLLPDFRIGPSGDVIWQRRQTSVVPIREDHRWEVTVIRGRTIERIGSEPASSRQQLSLSSLSKKGENGDTWVLDLARGQSISSLNDNSVKPGPPLSVKTDVQIRGRYVSIGLIVEGQAGEKYVVGVQKNRRRQPAPVLTIVDEAGGVLTSGTFKYG